MHRKGIGNKKTERDRRHRQQTQRQREQQLQVQQQPQKKQDEEEEKEEIEPGVGEEEQQEDKNFHITFSEPISVPMKPMGFGEMEVALDDETSYVLSIHDLLPFMMGNSNPFPMRIIPRTVPPLDYNTHPRQPGSISSTFPINVDRSTTSTTTTTREDTASPSSSLSVPSSINQPTTK